MSEKGTPFLFNGSDDFKIIALKGREALPYIDQLAAVRTKVFADFPYLYAGDLDYEREYLNTYFSSEKSFIVLALDAGKVVGASTAIWLPDAEPAFQKPFLEQKIDPKTVCYYGESVLQGEYRGRKVGQAFMQKREEFAESLPGVQWAAFCAVVRPKDHPRRPASYRPLDEFWLKTGFAPRPGMIAHFPWKDHDDKVETEKPMQFWLKKLSSAQT